MMIQKMSVFQKVWVKLIEGLLKMFLESKGGNNFQTENGLSLRSLGPPTPITIGNAIGDTNN